jgi:hypothetical protein
MIGELIIWLIKPLYEWAKAHSQQRVVVPIAPQAGDVMKSESGDIVTVREVAEHWVKCRRHDGTGFAMSKRGFLKHYRHNEKS